MTGEQRGKFEEKKIEKLKISIKNLKWERRERESERTNEKKIRNQKKKEFFFCNRFDDDEDDDDDGNLILDFFFHLPLLHHNQILFG